MVLHLRGGGQAASKPDDPASRARAPLPELLCLRPRSSIPRPVIEAVQADLDELTAKKETADAELAQVLVSVPGERAV